MCYFHAASLLAMLVTIGLVMLSADKEVVKTFLFDFQLLSKLIL